MVAMVISLLLIAGTITIFASNKQAYRLNEASSRVQENGRFALDFIRRDARMAGFLGCEGPSDLVSFRNNVNTTAYTALSGDKALISKAIINYDGTDSLTGFDSLGTGLSELGLASGTAEGNLVANTDAIMIKKAESCVGAKLTNAKDDDTFTIADNTNCGIQQNDIVLVSNCEGGDFFAVESNPGLTDAPATFSITGTTNTGATTFRSYGPEAEIFKFQTVIYYIGNGSAGIAPNKPPSLFKRSIVNGVFTNQELVENVEDMTISYGVDTTGDSSANFYVPAASVTAANWENVVSVRIRVDVRSEARNVLQGTASAEQRLRHFFTETIKVRNRI
jgi:type IV pilus assembly protein PilW